MRARAKSAKRIVEVQKHLRDIAESNHLKIKQKIEALEQDQRELAEALSGEGALHGLFTDITVRRINALRREVQELKPALEQSARALIEQGGRLKSAERLLSDLEVEVQRVDERSELEAILEAALAQDTASLKQDH